MYQNSLQVSSYVQVTLEDTEDLDVSGVRNS